MTIGKKRIIAITAHIRSQHIAIRIRFDSLDLSPLPKNKKAKHKTRLHSIDTIKCNNSFQRETSIKTNAIQNMS